MFTSKYQYFKVIIITFSVFSNIKSFPSNDNSSSPLSTPIMINSSLSSCFFVFFGVVVVLLLLFVSISIIY